MNTINQLKINELNERFYFFNLIADSDGQLAAEYIGDDKYNNEHKASSKHYESNKANAYSAEEKEIFELLNYSECKDGDFIYLDGDDYIFSSKAPFIN